MDNLPKLQGAEVANSTILVRCDLDVPMENGHVVDTSRLDAALPTLQYLLQNGAYRIVILGHSGRPKGKPNPELSLKPLVSFFTEKLEKETFFVPYEFFDRFRSGQLFDSQMRVILLENVRFWEGEEKNDPVFARDLAEISGGGVYVNEAFAVSHRDNASITGIPKILERKYAGLRLTAEIEHLSKITSNPKRPLVILISGIKDDKLKMVEHMAALADKVLVGGRLPEYIEKLESSGTQLSHNEKIVIARLNPDKEDITMKSIELFEEELFKAKTIVLAGVLGKVEDDGHQLGTRRVFEAVANAQAYKVAGGGDTEAALSKFRLTDKFSWISVGGGAMLEFLNKGTLPGIGALLDK